MSSAAHDAILQKPRPATVELHLRVVIALQSENVEIGEALQQRWRDAAKICRIAKTVAKAVDDESMRAGAIVGELNWLHLNSREDFERMPVECLNQTRKFVCERMVIDALQQFIN